MENYFKECFKDILENIGEVENNFEYVKEYLEARGIFYQLEIK